MRGSLFILTFMVDNIQILETRISITITPAHKQDAINMDEKFILCVVDIRVQSKLQNKQSNIPKKNAKIGTAQEKYIRREV